ncbi:MAG: FxsA family protein [Pseudomonadota bacterium]
MRFALVLIFVAVPIIELALLIQLGSWLGFWPTIGLILLTAVVGTAVLQQQGLETLNRVSQATARGEPPVEPIIDGMFLLVAGAFLLTPGVITDGIGLLLLVPQIRHLIRRWGVHRLMTSKNVRFHVFRSGQTDGPDAPQSSDFSGSRRGRDKPGAGPVIDGEYEHLGDRTIDPNRRRPKR